MTRTVLAIVEDIGPRSHVVYDQWIVRMEEHNNPEFVNIACSCNSRRHVIKRDQNQPTKDACSHLDHLFNGTNKSTSLTSEGEEFFTWRQAANALLK